MIIDCPTPAIRNWLGNVIRGWPRWMLCRAFRKHKLCSPWSIYIWYIWYCIYHIPHTFHIQLIYNISYILYYISYNIIHCTSMCIIFTDCMWWYQMTCFRKPRNAESTSALSQHWVSIKRPAPPLLMLASLVSIVLLGAPLERWQWCTCFMYPARCTIVFSSRIESNRNQSSHGLWPNSSLWWPIQIYAVCVCVFQYEGDWHIFTPPFSEKKKDIKPVRLLISFMHVDRSIMQMQRNSAVAHEVLTE